MLYGRHQGNTTTSPLTIPSSQNVLLNILGGGMTVSIILYLTGVLNLRFPDGEQVSGNGTEYFVGCRDSEFDQYGDIAAFNIYPEVGRSSSNC